MKFLEFALTIGKLKKIKRSGWLRHKIPSPESVADHSFRTAVLAMILAPQLGIDVNKAAKMALIHDIGEAKIGDIVTMIGTKTLPNLAAKIQQEKDAIRQIFQGIDAIEYSALFEEFEANQTPVAKFVKQIDKLEMGIQAYEYEKEDSSRNLQEFIDTVGQVVTEHKLRTLVEELNHLRK